MTSIFASSAGGFPSYAAMASTTVGHDELLRPVTVDPFAPAVADPAADTMHGEAVTQTVFAPAHDWQVATFSSLSDVEDLLDSLEAHGVKTREVVTLTDNCFAVRWK